MALSIKKELIKKLADFAVRLLGPFTAQLNGQYLKGFRSSKVRALLAYLSVESNRPWTRETLADLLWPNFPNKAAHSNLRNAISNLKKLVGEISSDTAFLDISQSTLQINLVNGSWLDVKEFMDSTQEICIKAEINPSQGGIELLEQALGLYRGQFMEGFSIDSEPFEDWILVTREHIRKRLLQILKILAIGYQKRGKLSTAAEFTQRYIELEPWDETVQRFQMKMLAANDQRSAAIVQYEKCREVLSDELGISPESETVKLYEEIRDGSFEITPNTSSTELGWSEIEDNPSYPFTNLFHGDQVRNAAFSLFVGRKKEINLLEDGLNNVIRGHGRIFFIEGEPGSGKTTLMTEFARRAVQIHKNLVVVWGQCNAFTGQGDPYFPFLNIIRMLSGETKTPISGDVISTEQQQRLINLFPATIESLIDYGPDILTRFLVIRELLSSTHKQSGLKPHSSKSLHAIIKRSMVEKDRHVLQQAAIFEQFTRVLDAIAQNHPLILLLDDLQWIDSGSVDLLFHLGRRLASSKILLVGAYRPEEVSLRNEQEPRSLQAVIREMQTAYGDIKINLMKSESKEFVEALVNSEPNELSNEFKSKLYHFTSGNPLFTIELLRGLQLRGEILCDENGRWIEGQHLDWEILPARVEAVIAGFFSYLSKECQDLLNNACVEGEQFTAEVMARVMKTDERRVYELLGDEIISQHRLVIADGVKQVGSQRLSNYRFRHSLFQIYLYKNLNAVEKAHLHGEIGNALEGIYHHDTDRLAETAHTLAHHFENAGMLKMAVQYYLQAGRYAIQLSANREAIDHFNHALDLIDSMPDSEEKDRQALGVHLSLGPPLTAIKGWAAYELEDNYRQAEQLCNRFTDDAQLIPALWLLAVYRLGRSDHKIVDRLVKRLYSLAQKIGDPELLCLSMLQVSPLYQGNLIEARQLLTRASYPIDLSVQRSLANRYGMASSIVGLGYLSNCLWLLGFPEKAEQCCQEACDYADQLNIHFTNCYIVSRACWLYCHAGNMEKTNEQANKLLQIARKHEFGNFEQAAIFFIGYVNTRSKKSNAAELDIMNQAMEDYQRLGTLLNRTTFLTLFADTCQIFDQINRGLSAIDESIELGQRTGERWLEAESYRIKGKLLIRQAENSEHPDIIFEKAERCFQSACQVAKQQGATMLELRATIDSIQLNRRKKIRQEDIIVLAGVLSRFQESFDFPDLVKGHELLSKLKTGTANLSK